MGTPRERVPLDDIHTSPPSSARFSFAANAGGCKYATLTKRIKAAALSKGRVAFDLRSSLTQEAVVAGLYASFEDGSACGLLYNMSPTNPFLLEQITPSDGGDMVNHVHGLPTGMKPDVWTRVTIDADYSVPQYSFTYDTFAIDTNVVISPEGKVVELELELGIHCASNLPSPLELRIDDVTFDVK